MKTRPCPHSRPCPHCGGNACLNASYNHKQKRYFIYVKCDICGAQGKIYTDPENPEIYDWNMPACQDAVTAWNMRTYPTLD